MIKKKKTSINSHKKKALFILIPLIVTHILLDIYYRPLAYINSFNDLGLKDSFTQITAIIGISLLMIIFEKEDTWYGKTGKIFLIIIPMIAMIIYEIIQIFIKRQTFDLQDIIYTLIGGIFIGIIQFKIIR